MPKVSFSESIYIKAYKVAVELMKDDFAIANCNGVETGATEHSSFGLLRGAKPEIKKVFFGLIPMCRRRDFVGMIYISDKSKGADNKNWVIEVYGRENVDEFKRIAESLSQTHGVDVHVRLELECSKVEMFN